MNADPTPPAPPATLATLAMRPAESDDAPALAALFTAARRAAEPAMPAGVHTPEEVRQWFADLLGDRRRETWVAEYDGGPVGYLVLDPEWLDSIYVRPDLTGQGIGSALLELAKSLRPHGFALWVFETNERAQRFYARHGLLVLERRDGRDNEERSPDIAMVWPGTDPVGHLRRKIDEVDAELGKALARRAALTAAVQQFKDVPGHQGRDPAREAQIARRLAEHAPNLGPDRIERIMAVVIGESLDAALERPGRSDGDESS